MQVKIPKQYQNLATVELVLKGVLLHALAQPRLQGFSLKKWGRGWLGALINKRGRAEKPRGDWGGSSFFTYEKFTSQVIYNVL